jgi:hypothetical protein
MSKEISTKNPCPPGCGSRKEIGLRLRQTHYILGKDDPNYMSEYRYEYNPKKAGLDHLNANRGIFLRNSHFMLGNTPVNYQTSSQAQSEEIPLENYLNTDGNADEIKNRLQKSHFILGNDNNNYTTKYISEYYNKNPLLKDKNKEEYERISNKLKETHIAPISDEINYESETQDKYRKPNLSSSNNNLNNISTAALQQSHLSLGNQDVPWISSSRYYMTPKKSTENKRYISTEKLQRSHLSLSMDKDGRNFKSEAMDSFVEYPLNLSRNNLDPVLKNNLRKEHFNFGNEDDPNNRISSNRVDFQDPRTNQRYVPKLHQNEIDPQKYRKSNWTISNGDERDFFKSTYNNMMTPKKPEIKKNIEVNTFKSSIKIGNNGPGDFLSEYKKKYNDNKLLLNLKNSSKDKKMMETIANIRRSHLDFGDNKNDYSTTNNDTYQYNPKLAKAGRGKIDENLKNDLMSSHYELGMGNNMETITSNRRDYRGYPGYIGSRKAEHDNSSHVFLRNRNIFEGESIYMSDYTEKPLPCPDDNLPDYLS